MKERMSARGWGEEKMMGKAWVWGLAAVVVMILAGCGGRVYGQTGGEKVVYRPTAPIAHPWIVHVFAAHSGDKLSISITCLAEAGLPRWEDISVAIVDASFTRAILEEAEGSFGGAVPSIDHTQLTVGFGIRTDAKEIRMVLVRVKDLVVALTPVAVNRDGKADVAE